jgi:hypothetical protein
MLTRNPVRSPVPRLFESVRVPDGRIGTVIGFYMRESESVLVRFSPGDIGEFAVTHVDPPRR